MGRKYWWRNLKNPKKKVKLTVLSTPRATTKRRRQLSRGASCMLENSLNQQQQLDTVHSLRIEVGGSMVEDSAFVAAPPPSTDPITNPKTKG